MDSKASNRWKLFLAISITLLVCGSIALINAGLTADENNLTNNFHPSLWGVLGVGIAGLVISLPAWFATRGKGQST